MAAGSCAVDESPGGGGGIFQRRYCDAKGDELRRAEGNQSNLSVPLLRDQALIEADAESSFYHIVGSEGISCGEAGLRMQMKGGKQAVLVSIMIGRGMDERLFL